MGRESLMKLTLRPRHPVARLSVDCAGVFHGFCVQVAYPGAHWLSLTKCSIPVSWCKHIPFALLMLKSVYTALRFFALI